MSYGFQQSVPPTDVLRSLADPTRRGLFEHLIQDGEQNVRSLPRAPASPKRPCPNT